MDDWMIFSEGSYDWEYYGYDDDWSDDFSFHNMEDWWNDFEDSWDSYSWYDTKWDDINYGDIHGDSSWGDDWWDSDSGDDWWDYDSGDDWWNYDSGDDWWDYDSGDNWDLEFYPMSDEWWGLTSDQWWNSGEWWHYDDSWYSILYSRWNTTDWACEGCTKIDGSCYSSADCGDRFCNFQPDWFSGGWCVPCRAETDQDCIDDDTVTELAKTECQSVCVAGGGTLERKLKARKLKARRKMGRALPKTLQTYMSNHACGANLGDSPECKKAKEDFSNADGMFEEMKLQGACLEHCDQACGFLVNSVSFLLISLCYLLFNENH